MKIKAIGFTSFQIENDNISLVTDPHFPQTLGIKVGSLEADVVLYSDEKNKRDANITPKNREKLFEINGAGEYEIADLLVQRPIGMPYYIIDYGYTRIVYVGLDSKNADKSMFTDLGDVEVLILPVGDGEMFPDYEKIQDIVNEVDPANLVPCGYMGKGIKSDVTLKTKEEFLKYFGYTNFSEEKTLKISGRQENEETAMNIIFIEK